jgi:hypothetical protein
VVSAPLMETFGSTQVLAWHARFVRTTPVPSTPTETAKVRAICAPVDIVSQSISPTSIGYPNYPGAQSTMFGSIACSTGMVPLAAGFIGPAHDTPVESLNFIVLNFEPNRSPPEWLVQYGNRSIAPGITYARLSILCAPRH